MSAVQQRQSSLTYKLNQLTSDNVLDQVDCLGVRVLNFTKDEHHLRDLLGVLVFPVSGDFGRVGFLRRGRHSW